MVSRWYQQQEQRRSLRVWYYLWPCAIGGTALGGVAIVDVGSVALTAASAWGDYKLVNWFKG